MKVATFFKATAYALAMHYRSWPRRAAEATGDALLYTAKAIGTVAGAVTAPFIAPFVVLYKGVDAERTAEAWAKLVRPCRRCRRTGVIGLTEMGYGRWCPFCRGKGHL